MSNSQLLGQLAEGVMRGIGAYHTTRTSLADKAAADKMAQDQNDRQNQSMDMNKQQFDWEKGADARHIQAIKDGMAAQSEAQLNAPYTENDFSTDYGAENLPIFMQLNKRVTHRQWGELMTQPMAAGLRTILASRSGSQADTPASPVPVAPVGAPPGVQQAQPDSLLGQGPMGPAGVGAPSAQAEVNNKLRGLPSAMLTAPTAGPGPMITGGIQAALAGLPAMLANVPQSTPQQLQAAPPSAPQVLPVAPQGILNPSPDASSTPPDGMTNGQWIGSQLWNAKRAAAEDKDTQRRLELTRISMQAIAAQAGVTDKVSADQYNNVFAPQYDALRKLIDPKADPVARIGGETLGARKVGAVEEANRIRALLADVTQKGYQLRMNQFDWLKIKDARDYAFKRDEWIDRTVQKGEDQTLARKRFNDDHNQFLKEASGNWKPGGDKAVSAKSPSSKYTPSVAAGIRKERSDLEDTINLSNLKLATGWTDAAGKALTPGARKAVHSVIHTAQVRRDRLNAYEKGLQGGGGVNYKAEIRKAMAKGPAWAKAINDAKRSSKHYSDQQIYESMVK